MMELFITIVQVSAVLVFVAAMAWAVICDVRSFQVRNRISVLVVLAVLVMMLASDRDWSDHLNNVVTGVAVLTAGFALFAIRLFGAGDVKLLAAVSLWIGWPHLLAYLFLVAVAGGIISVLLILFRRCRLSARLAATDWISEMHARTGDVPYAVAIAIPAILFLPRMPLVTGAFTP